MTIDKAKPLAGDKYQAYRLCVRLRNEMKLAKLERDYAAYIRIRHEWLQAEIHYTAFR